MTFTELKYTLAVDAESRFLCYIENDALQKLNLPIGTKEALSSLAVTLDESRYALGEKLSPRDKGDKILKEIDKLISEYWTGDTLPYIKLDGDINQLDNSFKGRSIFIVHPDTLTDEIAIALENQLRFTSKITLLVVNTDTSSPAYFRLIATDHNLALSYLTHLRNTKRNNTTKFEKYDIDRVMRDWYPEEETRTHLINAAKDVIDSFLFVKELNIYVPNFLVITSYHIKRFKRAQELLTKKYSPRFVMTLPCRFEDKEYTVLFPIIKGPKFR